jgi:hypothetical protein
MSEREDRPAGGPTSGRADTRAARRDRRERLEQSERRHRSRVAQGGIRAIAGQHLRRHNPYRLYVGHLRRRYLVLSDVALVLAGLVLVFLGAALSIYAVACLGSIVGAALGFTSTTFALMVVTSFIGAALASRSLPAAAALRAASEGVTLEPLRFDPLAATDVGRVTVPLFGMLFALGVLSQLGLFRVGRVLKPAALLLGIGRT